MAELGRAAFEDFRKDRLAAAIVLTRAAVETSAALWYLCAKVDTAVDSTDVGDIDDYLVQMIMGIATGAPANANTGEAITPRPIRIGKFLDRVETDIKGFKHQYKLLSEFAHPNWPGTVYLYAKHNRSKGVSDFGQNIREPEGAKRIGVAI